MNIRVRLLWMVFAVWLVAAVSFALLARSIYLQEAQSGREDVREFGRTLNLIIERELDKRASMARTLGASRALRDNHLEDFHAEASAAAAGTDSWVILVTPKEELVNTRLPFSADTRIPRPGFAPMILSGPPRTFFAPVGPVTHGPVVAVFAPELVVTPPRYDIGVAFEPRSIQAMVEEEQGDLPSSLVSVIDARQLIMARSRDPDRWVGRSAGPEITRRAREGVEGFLDSRTLDGVDSLTYTSAANHYGWTVIVATPKASLNLAARRLTIQAVTAAGVLLLIGLGLGLTVSRRIERPVQALRGAAGALREDQVPPRLDTGIRELDDISGVLHEAGMRSHDATHLLERRVQAAVREAEDAQAKLMDAQKHEAIGRLTGGLAHDFNNLLQTIRDQVVVSVSDTGAGMDESTMRRALEPYFTTKAIGAGSGLGLAQVRAFALQSGGDIRLHSEPGRGTRVEMFLPRAREADLAEATAATVASPAWQRLRILMVEDDLLIQSVVPPALEASGHEVTLVADAEAALAVLETDKPVDVLFTDIVMPGRMTGMDLAAWCRDHRPALPVVLATGYSAQASDDAAILRKPYELATLQQALALAVADKRGA